jgi:hypothetical protein
LVFARGRCHFSPHDPSLKRSMTAARIAEMTFTMQSPPN